MAIGGMYEGADSITNFEAAVDYMVEQKSKGVNIRVVNASFGEDVRDARELERWSAATRKLLDADILLVAATANGYGSNMDKTPGDRPANADFPNVVVVASLDRKQEKLANFSSYGPTTVDLAAPGEDIVSTIPRGKWDEMSGTSMATPHVAAAAALMFAANPELKATQVAELLLKTAVKDPDLAGKVLTGAKLDVKAAVKAAEALGPQDAGNDRVVTWS
jgi:subtilisin family serine protease